MADDLNDTKPPDESTVVADDGAVAELASEPREHFLVVLTGTKRGQRVALGGQALIIGRKPPARLVLPDPRISGRHCSVEIMGDTAIVSDLGSSNGSFVGEARIAAPTALFDGATLRVGDQWLRYEKRVRSEIEAAGELLRDLDAAGEYLRSLLPEPGPLGPLRLDWYYQPCAQLGGDAFGCHALDDQRHAIYLIDVSGHGTPAALHTVSLMNLLRHRALPGTDMAEPARVVAQLNTMFQMESHGGMYFTVWYGVYDAATRRLRYCSAGHPPALLVSADGRQRSELATPNFVAGAMADIAFVDAMADVSPGSRLYLFSDGAYEIETHEGSRWALANFLPLLGAAARGETDAAGEAQQLFHTVSRAARGGTLEDDFSMLVVAFPD